MPPRFFRPRPRQSRLGRVERPRLAAPIKIQLASCAFRLAPLRVASARRRRGPPAASYAASQRSFPRLRARRSAGVPPLGAARPSRSRSLYAPVRSAGSLAPRPTLSSLATLGAAAPLRWRPCRSHPRCALWYGLRGARGRVAAPASSRLPSARA